MATISIERTHELAHQDAMAAARKIAGDLQRRFALACKWEGDSATFERPGLSGNLRVGKSTLRLNVELSFLLSPMKGPIEQAIRKELDALFGKS